MTRPQGGRWWRDHAAAYVARYPLAATDWDAHTDALEAGLYGLQICSRSTAPAAGPDCDFADEPPLSPEEEEQAYWAAVDAGPAQMELF